MQFNFNSFILLAKYIISQRRALFIKQSIF